jgi:hypothetical protein
MDSDSGSMLPTPPSIGDASSSSSSSSSTPAATTNPRGALILLDHCGSLRALINAEELTAFRTALAATMLLRRREHVVTITRLRRRQAGVLAHPAGAAAARCRRAARQHHQPLVCARAQALLHELYGADGAAWRTPAPSSPR